MRTIFKITTGLTPIWLAACSGPVPTDKATPPQHSAHLYIGIDISGSSTLLGNDRVGDGIRQHAADAVKAMALGDSITIVEVGGLSAERFVAHPTITTGYELRQARASKQVVAQMQQIAHRFRTDGGDASTNLLLTLENLHPNCASGRSVVMLATDGVESSSAYDAGVALAAGKPVDLPAPSGRFLHGCKVAFVGFGIVATADGGPGQMLPQAQLEALRKGWTTYLTAAGVVPNDVTFTSLL